MIHLNLEHVEDCYTNDRNITWHDQYEQERWKDGIGPLTIIKISKMDWECVIKPVDCDLVKYELLRCGVVHYICSNPNCNRCTNQSLIIKGHLKVIKPDGLDPYGKVKCTETKKKTIMTVLTQPVFKEL